MPVLNLEEAVAAAVAKATKDLKLSAEEKKLFEKTLADDPELKGGWLRQDDYSRRMTEVQTKEAAAVARAAELNDWADKTIPKWDALKAEGIIDDNDEPIWKTTKAQLERERDEARALAAAGGDMDPEQLKKTVAEIVKQAGGATEEEIKNLIAAESKKIAVAEFDAGWEKQKTEFNEKTIPFVAGFSASAGIVAMRYEKETGEKWTPEKQKEMYSLMQAKKNYDPYSVEDDLLAPSRAKKAEDARVEAAVQERLKSMPRSQRAEQGGDEDYIPQAGEPVGALRAMMARTEEAKYGGDLESLIKDKAREAGRQLASGQ
jgi:hypothetical protein